MIIETCPKCGADLVCEVIDVYPPIYSRRCTKCEWNHEEQEKIVRVPFKPVYSGISEEQ